MIGFIYLTHSSIIVKKAFDFCYYVVRLFFNKTITNIEKNIKLSFIYHGDLVPGLYVWHPHGLFACTPYIHTALGMGENSPKMKLATLRFLLKMPIISEISKEIGVIDSDYNILKEELVKKNSVSLIVGGIEEIFYTESYKIKLNIKNRTGYLKLSLETKMPLIPVITYGENELYENIGEYTNSSWNKYIKNTLGIIIPFFKLKSLEPWSELKDKPFRPVHSYAGPPVFPEEDDTIDTLREKYLSALQDLFDKTHPEEYTMEFV
jgi:2-acylglycerol O-acyltransferase 2